jgi:DNA-binding response OmpR family regulator
MRLLIVEDEPDLADALARGLRREGYAVDVATSGDDGYVKARVYPYDLVCLDLGLPGMDGRTICRRLRESGSSSRVLMLTARDAVEDRIAGLDDGADDYLVKPFAFGELLARVRALTRREGVNAGAVLRTGDLELDAAAHNATRGGEPLALTPKEFALLRYLMSRAGDVVSEGELLQHVWDERADPRTRTVRVTVMTLRRKLGEPQPIETVVGAGYRLVAG